MTIEYVLSKINLATSNKPYVAKVQSKATATLEDVIELMNYRNSSVGKAATYAVLEDFFSAIERLLLDGSNVSTPLANFRTTIRGGFEKSTDSFESGLHTVTASATPGVRLRAAMPRAEISKIPKLSSLPLVLSYIDVDTDEEDSGVTPDGVGHIVGERLKFDESDAEQGVFYVNGSSEMKVSIVGKNMPSEIFLKVPPLTETEYTIEVRTRTTPNGELRVGKLGSVLTTN